MGNVLSGPSNTSHPEGVPGLSDIRLMYTSRTLVAAHDMTLPLSAYFISSGHNSYLEGNQLNSNSGVETITNSLLGGCRVIELDTYNQQPGFQGPVCKHGGTLTKPIEMRACVEAIKKDAFTKSPYPVIITIENHTDFENQKRMAQVLVDVLGPLLWVPFPWEMGKAWRSPEQLKHKIVIRTNVRDDWAPEMKQIVYIPNINFASLEAANTSETLASNSFNENAIPSIIKRAWAASGIPLKARKRSWAGDGTATTMIPETTSAVGATPASLTGSGESSGNQEDGGLNVSYARLSQSKAAGLIPDPGSGYASSRLLSTQHSSPVGLRPSGSGGNWARPTHPNELQTGLSYSGQSVNLRAARARDKAAAANAAIMEDEESSFVRKPGFFARKFLASASTEPDAETDDIVDAAGSVHSLGEVYTYTARHLMRVYPSGLRINSSNYNPVRAWSLGASIVALNWQVWDKPMWINKCFFSQNGDCGYVLKPPWMRQAVNHKAGDSQRGVPTNPLPTRTPFVLNVNIISAFCRQYARCLWFRDDLYVSVSVMGLPTDWNSHRTVTADNSARLYVDNIFQFPIQYPEMAVLMVCLWDEDVGHTKDELLGHWEIPIATLATGEFQISLTDHKNRLRTDRWVKLGLSWEGGNNPADVLEVDDPAPCPVLKTGTSLPRSQAMTTGIQAAAAEVVKGMGQDSATDLAEGQDSPTGFATAEVTMSPGPDAATKRAAGSFRA